MAWMKQADVVSSVHVALFVVRGSPHGDAVGQGEGGSGMRERNIYCELMTDDRGWPLIKFDPDDDEEARALLEKFHLNRAETPVVVCPSGTLLRNPSEFVLARGESRRRILRKRPDLVVTQTFRTNHNEELLLLQPRAAVHEDARPVAPTSSAPQ